MLSMKGHINPHHPVMADVMGSREKAQIVDFFSEIVLFLERKLNFSSRKFNEFQGFVILNTVSTQLKIF